MAAGPALRSPAVAPWLCVPSFQAVCRFNDFVAGVLSPAVPLLETVCWVIPAEPGRC